MKKTTLLLCFLAVLAVGSHAQEDAYTKRFVPPSPTASSLGQYGEVPVSLYTGVANISIPIYTVTERGLSVPIGLSYHASGIKVDQMPSWVGMGWALGAGGSITRTIMGLPDESTNGYYAHADRLEDYMNGVPDTGLTPSDEDLAWWVATGIWDSEPDVYYYSFGGMSGKMVFDKAGTPRMIPHNNMKVTGNVTTGFTVTSPDGTVYVFDEIEYTDTSTSGNDPNLVSGNTAFNLSSITATNGAKIDFTYESESQSYTVSSNQSQIHNMPGFTDSDCTTPGSVTTNDNLLVASVKRLSQIEADNITVKFIENTTANSFGMKYLDRIEVYDNADLVTPIKQFDFTIGNFGPGTSRGKLTQLVQQDGAGNPLSPYTFEYDDQIFPARLSNAQDHWGYYNGKTSNSSLIPASTLYSYNVNGSPYSINYTGADRSPDEAKAQATILKKINYPTGGSTAFEYGQHTYSAVGTSLIYQAQNYNVAESQNLEATAYNTVSSPTFVIDNLQNTDVKFYATGLAGISGEIAGSVEVVNNSTQLVVHSFSIPADNTTYSGSLTWSLSAGTYYLRANSDFGENIKAGINYLTPLNVPAPTAPSIATENAGGVRIEKITIHDGISTANDRIKTYDYHDGATSNGVLLFQPVYERFNTNVVRIQLEPGNGLQQLPVYIYKDCPMYNRSSSNMSALGATQGSHVGYSKVTEYLGEGANTNGKSEYEFTTSLDYPDSPSTHVAFPAALTSYDYKRGLLKKNTAFEVNASVYDPVIENSTNYTFRDDVNKTTIPAFKIAIRKNFEGEEDRNEYDVTTYNHVSQWYYSDSQVEKVFNQNATGFITGNTVYTYDATNLQVSTITTTNSEGQVELSLMEYAQDLNNTLLINRNMLNQVLKLTQRVDGVDIKKTETTFTEIGTGNTAVLPTTFRVYPTAGTESRYVTYAYNPTTKNVEELTKEGDLPKAYYWAYNDEYPIAEALNMTRTDLATAVAWAVTNMDSPPPGITDIGGLITYVGDMTTSLQRQAWANFSTKLNEHTLAKNAQISTMTYKLGFGMTSQTSPNGLVNYYEYDAHGRLKYVRDREGNILKMNEYTYKSIVSTTGN